LKSDNKNDIENRLYAISLEIDSIINMVESDFSVIEQVTQMSELHLKLHDINNSLLNDYIKHVLWQCLENGCADFTDENSRIMKLFSLML